MTLAPEQQYRTLSATRHRLGAGGTDFDTLPPDEQFAERLKEIGREVTLWLKRVRKVSGAPLRYLLVAERHKSGDPHLHILLTETDAAKPVRYRTLAQQWKLGFTKFNLARDSKVALYICKYISKDLSARVRASLGYGKDVKDTVENHREAVADRVPKKAPEKGEGYWHNPHQCTQKFEYIEDSSIANILYPPPALTDHSGGKNRNVTISSTPQECTEPQQGRPRLSEAARETPSFPACAGQRAEQDRTDPETVPPF